MKQTEIFSSQFQAALDALTELSPTAACLIQNGLIIRANRTCLHTLGYAHQTELTGRPLSSLMAAGDFHEQAPCLSRPGTGIRKNQSEFPLLLSAQTIDSPLGEMTLIYFVDLNEKNADAIKFRTLFESSRDAVMLLDEQGFFDCNSATLEIFGCATLSEFCSKHPADLSPTVQPGGEISLELANSHIARAFETGSHRFDWMHRRADTHQNFPAEVLLSAMELGGKKMLQASVRDITERKKLDENLRIAATAFDANVGIIVTDAEGRILKVNRTFSEHSGYSDEELIGCSPRTFKSGMHDANFYRAMWESIKITGSWQGEIWDKRKNGEIYPKLLTITAIRDDNGAITHYVGTHADITDRKEAESLINDLAFYDPLTRLPNRRLLQDRLQQAFASSERSDNFGAVLFLDLDHFKTINDTLGHIRGDQLLQQVAQRLSACVREGDTVARLGGDEFVVVLEELNEEKIIAAARAETIGEKILAALGQPYQLDTHKYHTSSSIGIALFKHREPGIDTLFRQADIAMYQSKKSGRNTLRFFDAHMQDTINTRMILEEELRKALENKQFLLHYQMQTDNEYRILGAETLIRWLHPERGMISPASFIPLAEETDLILPMGQWVLNTACAQIKAWENNPRTRAMTLSVNVSARQFHQSDFATKIRETIERHAIDPKLLKLELTESMLQEKIEDTISTMNTLKEIGVQFSLDDFGTGYSSLQYLKRLPLNQLKIDQSFVRDIATDNSDKAIVSTIIAMAHSLNLDVIAEGVETEEQRQFLLDNQCTHYQGYLFGKPVPIEQFNTLLSNEDKG